MKNSLIDLLPNEFESLMEALRRDLRSENAKAKTNLRWADWHRANVRQNIRILDAINPKRQVLHQLKLADAKNENTVLSSLTSARFR